MPDPLSFRSILTAGRLAAAANDADRKPSASEVTALPGLPSGIFADPVAGDRSLSAAPRPLQKIFASDVHRAHLITHLASEQILPQSISGRVRGAVAAPFVWLYSKMVRLVFGSPPAPRVPGTKSREWVEDIGPHKGSSLKTAETTQQESRIRESGFSARIDLESARPDHRLLGSDAHKADLVWNLAELNDSGIGSSDLPRLQRAKVILEGFRESKVAEHPAAVEDLLAGLKLESEERQVMLELIAEAQADSGSNVLDSQGETASADQNRPGGQVSLISISGALDKALVGTNQRILKAQREVKGTDYIQLADRSVTASRYASSAADVGTHAAIHAGAHSIVGAGLIIAEVAGIFNVLAGVFSAYRAIKSSKGAKLAKEKRVEVGQKMGQAVDQESGTMANLQGLLLEQKRRVEGSDEKGKRSDSRIQSAQATSYILKASFWAIGIISVVAAVPVAVFGLTIAGLVASCLGVGLSGYAWISKLKREVADANKAAGLQMLAETFEKSKDSNHAIATLETIKNSNDPAMQDDARRAEFALKLLDQINQNPKYESLVGSRRLSGPNEYNPASITYTRDQILEIASYKAAIRNSKGLARAYLQAIQSEQGKGASAAEAFLKTALNWSDTDIEHLNGLMRYDLRKAEDFFCAHNNLPKYQTA